jgi:hypothetical protein
LPWNGRWKNPSAFDVRHALRLVEDDTAAIQTG